MSAPLTNDDIDYIEKQLKGTTKGMNSKWPPTQQQINWYNAFVRLESGRTFTPPVTPPLSTSTKPFGVLRNGTSYSTATGYDRYGMVCSGIADSDQVAKLPDSTKKLVYMDYFEAASWFTGISQADSAPYYLATETGAYEGVILLDPAAPGLGAKLIDGITNFLTYHKLNGYYSDNCVADPATFSAVLPAKYNSPQAWWLAVQALTIEVGTEMKKRGFYVGANMLAYFPGNVGIFPGTNSDDGTAVAKWIQMCAPGLSFVLLEEWMWANNGHLRTTAAEWDDDWNSWQNLVRVTQDAGLDFVPCIQGGHGDAGIVYTQASFLLDKDDNKNGGVMVDGGNDPWSSTWTHIVGKSKGLKTKTGNIWSREFDDGSGGTLIVTVDPVNAKASIGW